MGEWCSKCNKYHDSMTVGDCCPMAGLMISPVLSDPSPLLPLVRELRDALRLMFAAIPDGWSVPLLYSNIVGQCKEVATRVDKALAGAPPEQGLSPEALASVKQGLTQKGMVDRGPFAVYVERTETITTSEATKQAFAGAESQEGKHA